MRRRFNGPDRLARFYYFLGDGLGDLAKHFTYRGGERSPRWLMERAGDYFVFRGVFRYQDLMKKASFDDFHSYLNRRYGKGNSNVPIE